jgi:lipopolysaccharide transport system ATP-binding protein
MAVIRVNHVSKEYRLGQLLSLRQSLQNAFARLRGHPVALQAPFKALDDVDFKVEDGEVLGIIGENGAGKSTLLKLLAGISVPTNGSVSVPGTVAPLIEVGAGMVPDLTGRENIYLNAVILGMRRAEIKKKFDAIVAFAELEEFIDTPIKRYSSGMQVRLGFSVATSMDSDILIVDEVLAVGDLAFQRKCFDRMEDMIRRQGKTVLLVSHNIRQVERMCNRVLLLDHGKIFADGKPKEICDLFYERSDVRIKTQSSQLPGKSLGSFQRGSGELELLSALLLDSTGRPVDKIEHGAEATVKLVFEAKSALNTPTFGVGIHTTDLLFLATKASEGQLDLHAIGPGVFAVLFHIARFPFLPGVYSLRVGVSVGELHSVALYAEGVIQFQVESASINRARTMNEGFVPLEGRWEVDECASQVKEKPIRDKRIKASAQVFGKR